MKRLLIIILTVINLALFCSAVDFSIQFPGKVYVNNSFNVKIISNSTDNYDVKIFIESDKIISQIHDEYWKSSNYYIKSSFPKIKDYQIRPNKVSNNTKLCVRLRKSFQSKYTEECKSINVYEISEENEGPILLYNNREQINFISKREETVILSFIFFILLSFIILILLILKKI